MEGGRSSDHHRTDKDSPLTFPEASIAAVLFIFITARQEFSSPPHAAIPFIEKRDPRRVDEPGSLRGGLCQTRIYLTDQSVPPPPKGRRESCEEDGRDDEMMGMSYRISYYTMASLSSSKRGSCTTRVHGSLGIYSSSLQPGKVRRSLQVLRFDYEGALLRRKTQLMCKVLQAHGRNLTHSSDRRTRYLDCGGLGRTFFPNKDGMIGKTSRQIEFACKGRHIRE